MSLNLEIEFYPKLSDEKINRAIDLINKNKNKYSEPFFFDTTTYLDFETIRKTTQQFINDDIKNIIVLGTGGSIQTLLALEHLAKKRIYPITSSRAVELARCLKRTTPKNSLVIPISRGGETLDINSTIGIFVERGYNFLGLSSKGTMNEMLRDLDCPILDVPDLSGRYAGSMTNVGIIPAYLSGININEFIKGLQEGYKKFSILNKNLALEFAVFLHHLYQQGYKVVFSMPYSKNIEESVGLWIQVISESSGKNEKGLLGAYQTAPLCQHSVLEYLLGGTKGIVIPTIWLIADEEPDLKLSSSIDYINGQTAQSIVNYQANATFQALIQQSIPSAKILVTNPKEFAIGNLISFILTAIYYLCLLLDVNWANNPMVIIGKKICNEALEKKLNSTEQKRIREEIAKDSYRFLK